MISQEWTKHLKEQTDKDQFWAAVQAARPVLDRLKEMVQQKETSMDRQEMSLDSYDSPNWEYRQAHQNGFRQCLAGYKRLLDIDQKEETRNEPTQFIRV